VRTDPSDNGGLFIGRRPGTAPVRYRAVPEPGGARRRAADRAFAASLLGLMGLVAATFWGPIPLAWLWVAAQVQVRTDSVSLAIALAFAGMLATLMLGLSAMRRLDAFWILVRRAGGHDQRAGMIGPVFAVAAVIGTTLFCVWLFVIAGPGSSLAPAGG
jgi:hypothetical protein